MRIGVLTGGGDAPGLNPFLRSLVRGLGAGDLLVGFEDAFLGLVEGRSVTLDRQMTRGIQREGGTILGSSNRANPFAMDGRDRSADAAATLEKCGVDVLVAVGGDGTLELARRFGEARKVRIVGVPKTIDGDVAGTEAMLGFATAVSVASEAIDRLQATASSHHRAIALEVMGRGCGRLALSAALAGGSPVALLPEFPFQISAVAEVVTRRQRDARRSSILVVAEGARPEGGEERHRPAHVPGAATPLGGIAEEVAAAVERETGVESRAVVLGHVVRGAPPVAEDRLLAARLAAAALAAARGSTESVALVTRGERVEAVPLGTVAGRVRTLTADDPLVVTARELGVSFGR